MARLWVRHLRWRGKLENLTDYYRVKDFMDIVKEFRRECFYNY